MNRTFAVSARDILIGCFVLGFLFCYAGPFLFLVHQWRSNEIYSHGFLIPFISLYLLHLQREKIDRVELRPDYLGGIPALVVALLCLFTGRIAGIVLLEEISIVMAVTGIVVLFFGKLLLRAVWFPVFYLLLMVPMWDLFTERAQLPFQLLSATIGVKMLNLAQIPIHQSGTYIEMPGITLEVAKACSGLNYLISVIAIGIPLFYIYIKGWVKRSLVLLFSAAVALLSNGVRVFLVGLFAYGGILGDNQDIHGPLHVFQALFVSVIGYIVIFVTIWVVKDNDPKTKTRQEERGSLRKRILDHVGVIPLACAVVLTGAFGGLVNFYKMSPVSPKQDFGSFPYRIESWEGKDVEPAFKLFRTNGADVELSRNYTSDLTYPVNLYIGYYRHQEQRKKMINYSTDYLFKDTDPIGLEIEPGRKVDLNRYIETGNGKRILYLYWIQVDGRMFLSKYREKIFTIWNAVTKRKTNGAVVMVSVEVPGNVRIDEAQGAGEEFVRRIYPILPAYIP